MKKTLLFAFAVFMGVASMEAQTVVFEDDFESYDDGYNLTEAGYAVWEGTAIVTDVTVAGGEAFSGNKFAQCTPGGNNYYFRKSLTLEEGKTYTFEVMTKSPDGKNHRAVASLNGRNVQGDLVNATVWTKTSLTFTVGAGETEAVLWVYSFPISRVDVDDFKLVEETATSITQVEDQAVQVYQPAAGEFSLRAATAISSVKVFDISGQLVKQILKAGATELRFSLNELPQGLFILQIEDVRGNVSVKKVVNN